LNIRKINREKLFSIETNTDFALCSTNISQDIISITSAFTSKVPVLVKKILKPSPTSVLYKVHLENGLILVIRGTSISSANLVSAQCELIKLLPDSVFVKPIKTKENEWVFLLNNFAWMAYNYIPGDIYDGNNCDLDILLDTLINFESSISLASEKLPIKYKKKIPTQKHRIFDWVRFYEKLLDSPQLVLKSIGIELSTLSNTFLTDNRSYVLELVKETLPLINSSSPKLVHNDINHANIIIKKNRPIFLDIEDIIFEIPEISVTHALFKLLRHKIYLKQAPVEEAGLEIDKYLPKLFDEGYKIPNKQTFFLYGSARIFSDIFTICMKVIEDNNNDLVYDLEKKIHNLIELYLILWSKHGFKT